MTESNDMVDGTAATAGDGMVVMEVDGMADTEAVGITAVVTTGMPWSSGKASALWPVPVATECFPMAPIWLVNNC